MARPRGNQQIPLLQREREERRRERFGEVNGNRDRRRRSRSPRRRHQRESPRRENPRRHVGADQRDFRNRNRARQHGHRNAYIPRTREPNHQINQRQRQIGGGGAPRHRDLRQIIGRERQEDVGRTRVNGNLRKIVQNMIFFQKNICI